MNKKKWIKSLELENFLLHKGFDALQSNNEKLKQMNSKFKLEEKRYTDLLRYTQFIENSLTPSILDMIKEEYLKTLEKDNG